MKHGRKSKEDKAQAFTVIEGDFGGIRPPPPPDMNARQQELWRLIVNDEPVTHFATAATRQLLGDFIFHLDQGEIVKAAISSFPVADALRTKDGREAYRQLTRSLDIHTQGSARLATKLRLTNQSRYTPIAASNASRNTLKGIKPWEI